MDRCSHWDAVDLEVSPGAVEVCEDCVAEGTTWVSLRICKTCGHVGCCDSSPRRHARAHHDQTGHPVMAPVGTGHGDWLWCYPDDAYVEKDGTLRR